MAGRLDWLDTCSSNNSKITYRSALKNYFKFTYPSVLEAFEEKEKRLIRQEDLEIWAERYLTENRNYKRDIEAFFAYLQNEKRAPYSISNTISLVRTFLCGNDVELPLKFWKGLKRKQKQKGGVVEDKIPTQAELLNMLSYMTNGRLPIRF